MRLVSFLSVSVALTLVGFGILSAEEQPVNAANKTKGWGDTLIYESLLTARGRFLLFVGEQLTEVL